MNLAGLRSVLALGFATAALTEVALNASVGADAAETPSRHSLGAVRPNIVLVSADDMRADDLRYMPHTRRLIARHGTAFRNALSNYPLCCPARASLLTGQYSHNHGVLGNSYPQGGYRKFHERAENNTLPVWLSAAGYRTAFVGKYLNGYGTGDSEQWGVPPEYVPSGWDEWHASVGLAQRYYCPRLNENGSIRQYPNRYVTDVYTAASVRLVKRYAAARQPLFLWVSHVAPHSALPLEAPCWRGILPAAAAPRHRGMFKNLPLPVTPATNESDMTDKGSYPQTRDLLDLDHQRSINQGRAQALQAVDESVAEIVRSLRERSTLKTTVFIFTSDNGYFLGEHRMVDKRFPYEEALKIPLLIRGPGFPAGQVRHQPVGLVDLPATAIHLAGARPVADGERIRQDGIQLVRLARDSSYLTHRVMPIESGPERAIQSQVVSPVPDWFYRGANTSRYSYIAWDMGGGSDAEEEFYDLDVDPYQLDGRPSRSPAAVVLAMRQVSNDLEDCAGSGCVRTLAGSATRAPSDPPPVSAPPQVRVLARPDGWVRTATPVLRYVAYDPEGGPLRFWCNHHASGCSDGEVRYQLPGAGRHYWSLFVGDSTDNLTSRVGSVRVDLARPVVKRAGPRYAAPEGSTLLEWRATDAASGVDMLRLRRNTAPMTEAFTGWTYPIDWQDRSSSTLRLTPARRGSTVCVEARVIDGAGWRSAWRGTACRAAPRDAARFADDLWVTSKRRTWYGATRTATRAHGASIKVPFKGNPALITVTAQFAPSAGQIVLEVGRRVVARLDLDAPQQKVRTVRIPSPSTLRGPIAATVVSRARIVAIDAIGVVRRL